MDRTEGSARLHRAAVVGGGTAGRGIAQALADAGIDVLLLEVDEARARRAREQLREGMDREIRRWAITEAERDATLSRIRASHELAEVADHPLVVESITEDRKEKGTLFRELDRLCPPETVFLTNTSTLSLTELGEELSPDRRTRFAGLHVLHPVARTPLVELVRGRDTADRTLAVARELARRLGKEVIEVAEYPGFVTTRLTLVLINEAVHTLAEGVATRDAIDRTMKVRFGGRLGPLGLADEIGLDSVVRALESIWRELGLPQYRPAPLLRRMVSRGWVGEKVARGFYRYDERGERVEDPSDVGEPSLDRLLGRPDEGAEGGR